MVQPVRLITRFLMGLLLVLTTGIAAMPAVAESTCEPVTPVAAAASPSDGAEATPAAVLPFPEGGGELTVFAAASLTDVFDEFASGLEEANPGLTITIETGGSQALVTQLQEGAKADVLATANTSTMQNAVDSGLVTGDPQTFTGNRLVIVTPNDNPAGITSLDDLAGDGVKLVVANKDVPAGNYARKALCAYQDAGHDGISDTVLGNVVSEEEDVRSVMTKVLLGEADVGIVYASDATASDIAGDPLNVIEFPEGVPVTATYPIAALAGGNEELANAFISALLGPDGQAALATYGFGTP